MVLPLPHGLEASGAGDGLMAELGLVVIAVVIVDLVAVVTGLVCGKGKRESAETCQLDRSKADKMQTKGLVVSSPNPNMMAVCVG